MKLNKCENKLFFALLRSALWQKPLEVQVEAGFDWTNVLNLLKVHSLLGITADCIMSLPTECLPNENQQNYIFQRTLSLARTHHRLNKSIVDVYSLYKKNGIDMVLLKGQGLSAIYPMDFTRSCGDIDIYVGEKQYEDACRLIDEYCGKEAVDASEETTCHYEIKSGKSKFELHRKVTDSAVASNDIIFNKWADEMLTADKCKSVKINECLIPVPSDIFNVIYIYDHLLRHFVTQGIGLRQFADWALVLHQWHLNMIELSDIERSNCYKYLEKKLKEFGIFRAWRILGGMLVFDFGLPQDEFPFYSKKYASLCHKHFAKIVLYSGNMGEQLTKGNVSLLRKILPATFAPNFHLKHFIFCTFLLPNQVFEHIRNFFGLYLKKESPKVTYVPHKGEFSDPFRKLKKK